MKNTVFPSKGTLWRELEEELLKSKDGDFDWRHAAFGIGWPTSPDIIDAVAKQAANIFFNYDVSENYAQPSVQKIEFEVMQMTLEILNGPDGSVCTVTSGGTESNFHAVKTARDWARVNRPEAKAPELLIPYTAHPSFNKAASYLGPKVVRVPQGDDLRADVHAMSNAINDNTIMIVGSAPTWPHGKVDPIPALAKLAQSHGIWCHVDACVGGFLIPFLKELGHDVPDFDFAIPGVSSISADLHKYGFAPRGVSTFSLRDEANLEYQKFHFDDWPYGVHSSATFTGTRNPIMIVAAWAVMKHLGFEGYLKIAEGILRTTRMMVDGILAIDGLELVTEPEAGIVVYTSNTVDIFVVADGMTGRGYPTSRCARPPSIHLNMESIEDDTLVTDYLRDLADMVDSVKAGKF